MSDESDQFPVPAPTVDEAPAAEHGLDGDEIRTLIARLARPHRSGGFMVERAALMAAGTSFTAIVDWIEAHGGKAEAVPPAPPSRGLFAGRGSEAPVQSTRWLLPADALS